MTDLKERLSDIEGLAQPDLWDEIEDRAHPAMARSRPSPVETVLKQDRHRVVGRRVALGAVVAGVLAVAIALPSVLPNGRGAAQRTAAAAFLLRASTVAAHQPAAAVPGPGQFLYTKTETTGGAQNYNVVTQDGYYQVLDRQWDETWAATDGSGRDRLKSGPGTIPSAKERAVWISAGRPSLAARTTDQMFKKGGLAYVDLSGLPRYPKQLLKAIEDRKAEGGPPGARETFTIIGDLLRQAYPWPKLRAALFQVAAGIPGVELVSPVTDPVGRTGVSIEETSNGIRSEWIFDPETSALLAVRVTVLHPRPSAYPDAQTVWWEAYLARGVVNSTSQRPKTDADFASG